MTETKKKIKYLIADTTAFINAVQLNVSFFQFLIRLFVSNVISKLFFEI